MVAAVADEDAEEDVAGGGGGGAEEVGFDIISTMLHAEMGGSGAMGCASYTPLRP